MLTVEAAAVDQVAITCRSRFLIQHPSSLRGAKRDRAIAEAMDCWLRERCLDDATRMARRHAARLDVEPGGVRLSDSRQYWGTCGKDRVVRVHADLIQAPAAVLEYVVAHEVVHLVERNHSPKFWKVLASTMPDWEERKRVLEQWESDGGVVRHRDL
jgi:predicted metal-dependent hydrolase